MCAMSNDHSSSENVFQFRDRDECTTTMATAIHFRDRDEQHSTTTMATAITTTAQAIKTTVTKLITSVMEPKHTGGNAMIFY